MIYHIFEQDQKINTIVASPEFVEDWCAEQGYTYEPEVDIPESEIPPTPDITVRIASLEQTKADKSDVDAIAAAVERGLSL